MPPAPVPGPCVKAEGSGAAGAAAVEAYKGRIEYVIGAVDKLHKTLRAPAAAGRLLPFLRPELLRADPKVCSVRAPGTLRWGRHPPPSPLMRPPTHTPLP